MAVQAVQPALPSELSLPCCLASMQLHAQQRANVRGSLQSTGQHVRQPCNPQRRTKCWQQPGQAHAAHATWLWCTQPDPVRGCMQGSYYDPDLVALFNAHNAAVSGQAAAPAVAAPTTSAPASSGVTGASTGTGITSNTGTTAATTTAGRRLLA